MMSSTGATPALLIRRGGRRQGRRHRPVHRLRCPRHLFAAPVDALRETGRGDVLVFVGGAIPGADATGLEQAGVTRPFSPGAWLRGSTTWLETTPRRAAADGAPAALGRQA